MPMLIIGPGNSLLAGTVSDGWTLRFGQNHGFTSNATTLMNEMQNSIQQN
jgi:hypothetical protein